jgi:nitronate monooxygenase
VRTTRAAVDLPLIAAGGITDGAGVAAALALGAAAAQVGTAYLLSEEAIVNPVWRQAIETAPDDPTRLTRVISGKYARGIDNAFMREMLPREAEVPPYPIQNALTQELRAAAAKAGSPDVLSLWAGQAVRLARKGGAAEITQALWREAQEVMRAQVKRWG